MKALITGATSGIGREMAILLAGQGVELILASRDRKKMQALARRLPVSVRIIPVDLSREADCFYLYEETKNEEIDILINNAGFGAFGCSWEVPLETELNMLDLNVRAVHILTKLFLADFRRRDHGYILNVASAAGFLAGPMMSAYYATKAYVLRYTEAIHEELRQSGSRVKISALCPGHVETGFDRRANVKHSIGGVSARKVARAGIAGLLRGDVVILPGALMKLTYWGEKLLSEGLLLRAAYFAQSRKK
ncbi:MAG: SDR family oxidoreductase [Bacillota bacterium]|nr:SDR family oxidoreductase [Bacillota bacterium]